MSTWLLAAGWLVAVTLAVVARRELAARAEAVADACHELRGPLTSARLGLDLGVRVGGLSGPQVRAIELELQRAALALDDFRGGRRERRAESVGVRALVMDCVEAWRPGAACGIRFEWHGGEAWVIGDRLRLAQATGNLISNALEHGEGLVEVIGRFERGVVRIEVIDGGPGLPAPVAELTRTARRGRPGRGRGLAIVSSIAASHGGRLAAAPTARGARVVLALPALGAPAGRAWSASTAQGSGGNTQDDELSHRAGAGAETIAAVDTGVPSEYLDAVRQIRHARESDLIERALNAARERLGMDAAYIARVDSRQQTIEAMVGQTNAEALAEGAVIPVEQTYCARMLKGEIPNIVADTAAEPALRQVTVIRNIGSYIGVPVTLSDGRVHGSLCCASNDPRGDLGEPELRFMRVLAEIVGARMDRVEGSMIRIAKRLTPAD